MHFSFASGKKFFCRTAALLIFLLLITAVVCYRLHLVGFYWLTTQINTQDSNHQMIGLQNYWVDIEAKPVTGIKKNLSGLAFSTSTGTLFGTINAPPTLVELSTDGTLLRSLPIVGIADPEAVAIIGDSRLVVSAEREHTVYLFTIDAQMTEIDATKALKLSLDYDSGKNQGIEGLSWDTENQRLYIAKEKKPLQILIADNLSSAQSDITKDITIREWLPDKASALSLLRDLASIESDKQTGHLLLLSDESKMITEYDVSGNLISMMFLWKYFHGLKQAIPQAEGIALAPDRTLYIVSEPNLFYRLRPSNS